jgi:hypothetical protein
MLSGFILMAERRHVVYNTPAYVRKQPASDLCQRNGILLILMMPSGEYRGDLLNYVTTSSFNM